MEKSEKKCFTFCPIFLLKVCWRFLAELFIGTQSVYHYYCYISSFIFLHLTSFLQCWPPKNRSRTPLRSSCLLLFWWSKQAEYYLEQCSLLIITKNISTATESHSINTHIASVAFRRGKKYGAHKYIIWEKENVQWRPLCKCYHHHHDNHKSPWSISVSVCMYLGENWLVASSHFFGYLCAHTG